MLGTEMDVQPAVDEETPPTQPLLTAELDFYGAYDWCLNPHQTVRETVGHLRREIGRLRTIHGDWQAREVATNVVLLSCALSNAVDEYLRGPTLRLPRRLAAMRFGRGARWATDRVQDALLGRRRAQVRRWKQRWQANLDDFVAPFVAEGTCCPPGFAGFGDALAESLLVPLPPDLQAEHIGVPTPFRRLDLTHLDILALGRQFAAQFPDRSQPLLLLGLRTSGCYFAPLLRAFLRSEEYRSVSSLTIQPNKGLGRSEREELARYVGRGCMALILDDPPHTGGTAVLGYGIARRAGFGPDRLKVLAPAHPARRNWSRLLPNDVAVSLEPEHWHKRRLLEPAAVEERLTEYFRNHGFDTLRVVASDRAERLNARLDELARDERSNRLKRIYEVHLGKTHCEHEEVRYVLAKSVGWGWLGYHAFLAGHRLSGFVPPVLGQRDGILYSEWILQPSAMDDEAAQPAARERRIEAAALYVAARSRRLRLEAVVAGDRLHRHQDGLRLLEQVLSRAYGRAVTNTLRRPHLQRLLCERPCPVPTLIDGRMGRADWIDGPRGLLKTDFEHHGMGKAELNVTDPAYDLAETILDLALSPEEEKRLLRRYIEASGDTDVGARLFLNKLLAGFWAMETAQKHLFGRPRTADQQQESHRQFMGAWDFLTRHTARFCGDHCRRPQELRWSSPLVLLDIDGVLDRRLFGFPCTTAAGIEALSLLSAHGYSVALNTARSVAEVKEYCDAYSLAGGVAEYGSYLWDAVAQRSRVLVSPEALRQLDELRTHLRQVPGVFLDDRHRYSIRAFAYEKKPRGAIASFIGSVRSFSIGEGAPVPLPTLLMHHLMADLGLDRLSFHHTTVDTTVTGKDNDKGTGLSTLRDWVLGPNAETIAVGDSEPDLPMFRSATRSAAPGHIDCARQALLLGCEIARHRYQKGLLEIVRSLIHSDSRHPDGRRCERCANDQALSRRNQDVFLGLLQAAEQGRAGILAAALADRGLIRLLVR